MVLKLIRKFTPPRQVHDGERATLLTVLFSLTWIQLAHLFSGWLAQTCDSIDTFNVVLNSERLKDQFHQDAEIVMMMVITLNSLFRIFGAAVFGILSDGFGRKWLLVAILLLSSLLQLGTGFTQTIEQFLILRTLSGFIMGGVWGIVVSNGLENLPVEARGFASGILGQGSAFGYLLSILMNTYFLTMDNRHSWRMLFWIGSGLIAFTAIVRAAIPESRAFLRANSRRESQRRLGTGRGSKSIIREAVLAVKANWKSYALCVGIVANLNSAVHGSQDLYPIFLMETKHVTIHHLTIAVVVGSCGAIIGTVIAGSVSQVVGRRLTMILFLLLGAVFIPLWMLPSAFAKLCAGVFWVQFSVQGATGVVPIWLAELSPPGFSASFIGVIAQLGSMLGSGSGEIETILAGAEQLKKTIIVDGIRLEVPGYQTAMCIIFGLAILFTLQFLFFASENHGSHFEARNATFEGGFQTDGHTPVHVSLEEAKDPHFTVKHMELEISGKLWSS